jgi:hypothetical protein
VIASTQPCRSSEATDPSTANTYTHLLLDEAEVDYAVRLAELPVTR